MWFNEIQFLYSLAPKPWDPSALSPGTAQEAYAAMLANPVAERRLELLRELLRALADRGALVTLLSLPLAGTADVPHGERCAACAPPSHVATLLSLPLAGTAGVPQGDGCTAAARCGGSCPGGWPASGSCCRRPGGG